jgi:hypothetical protein
MKKRFSMGWLLIVLWALSACSAPVSPGDIVASHTVTFQVLQTEPITMSASIEEELNAFELLKNAAEEADVHLLYSESEFGIFIEAIGALQPPVGAYITISLNDEPLSVGLDEAPFEPGDVFTFQLEFGNEDAKLRFQAIQNFLVSEADIFKDTQSYEVFNGLSLLNQLDGMPTLAIPSNEIEVIRGILITRSLQQDPSNLQSQLASLYTTDFIFRASLGLLALMESPYYGDALSAYNKRLETTDLFTTSFDDLAMIIIALDTAAPPLVVETFKSQLFDYLNAPSIAHAIMALLVLEENPYDFEDEDGVHLVDHLLRLQDESGGFKYDSNSAATDTRQFSSPQSFLALVVLDQWMNSNQVYPYRP